MKYGFISENKELMKEWNWEKNNSLGIFPDKIRRGSAIKAWWICNKCGYEWLTRVSHRNSGTGCKNCLHKDLSTAVKGEDLESLFPDIAKEWNLRKNSVLPNQVYPQSNKKYWWICDKGHEWLDSASHRTTRGNGCPYCSNHRVLKAFNDLETTHPNLLKEWDWKENNKIKIYPDSITYGSKKIVNWICKKGHKWQSAIYSRRDNGCPYCNKELKTSFPEKAIAFYVSQIFPDLVENYKDKNINRYELDMFIPSIRLGIEYDGKAWHKDYKRDLLKDELCYKNNINIIRIREKGCPRYDSSSIKIYLKDNSNLELKNAIEHIFDILKKYLDVEKNIDIDRDYIFIMRNVLSVEKIKSISELKIIEEWNWKKNVNINPKYISLYSNKKYWWICNKGHEWFASVNHRTNGRNCPYCAGQKILIGYNDLESQYPIISKEWDYEKNEKKPEEVTYKSNKKYWWICSKCGFGWKTSVYVRTAMGCGCPKCKANKLAKLSSRKVECVETGIIYESIKEAGIKTNTNHGGISNCCRGITKTAGGFHWKYVDEKKD